MKSISRDSECRQAIVGALLAAVTLLASGCGRSKEHVVKGPVKVSYEVQMSETRKSSSSSTYREIQILDQCVLLVNTDGKGGSLIPISKLNHLSWRKEQMSNRALEAVALIFFADALSQSIGFEQDAAPNPESVVASPGLVS